MVGVFLSCGVFSSVAMYSFFFVGVLLCMQVRPVFYRVTLHTVPFSNYFLHRWFLTHFLCLPSFCLVVNFVSCFSWDNVPNVTIMAKLSIYTFWCIFILFFSLGYKKNLFYFGVSLFFSLGLCPVHQFSLFIGLFVYCAVLQ